MSSNSIVLPPNTRRVIEWVRSIHHLTRGQERIDIHSLSMMLRAPLSDLVPALDVLRKSGALTVTADGRLYPTTEIARVAKPFVKGAAA